MACVTAVFVDHMLEMSSDAVSVMALVAVIDGKPKQVNIGLPCDAHGLAAALRVLASEVEKCQ